MCISMSWFYSVLCLTVIVKLIICDDEPKYSYHFDRVESENVGNDEIFQYNMSVVKKDGSDSVFVIQANINQMVELNDEWKTVVTVERSDTADGEFKQFLKLPTVGVCMFMKTIYKKYFYEKIKDFSNMPHYEKCPLTTEQYWIKDYPFDADQFKSIAKPGFYVAKALLMRDNDVKKRVFLYGSVTE